MDLKHLMEELLVELGKVSKADSVVGNVRDAGSAKVLPLSKVSIGFGTAVGGVGGKSSAGVGDADASAGGAGGAVVVEPRAFVVVGEDGVPHMLCRTARPPWYVAVCASCRRRTAPTSLGARTFRR
jgi:uncharacterized spore protein YtfJ